jgi:outer membrane protein TolC
VRRSERALAAQHARIGVAKAELYPIFSLPGTLTLEAFDVGNLNSGALAYSFGPSFRWSLFSAGRVRNRVRAEEARTQQALNQYEQVVLQAVSEVESAMAALAEQRNRHGALLEAVAAAERSVELVRTLYRSGLTNFQNVLDMERTLAEQQDELATNEGLMSRALIRLYTALGGGWRPEGGAPDAASAEAGEETNG